MNVYLKYGVNFLKFGKLVFKTCSHSVSIKTSEVMKACRTKWSRHVMLYMRLNTIFTGLC